MVGGAARGDAGEDRIEILDAGRGFGSRFLALIEQSRQDARLLRDFFFQVHALYSSSPPVIDLHLVQAGQVTPQPRQKALIITPLGMMPEDIRQGDRARERHILQMREARDVFRP